MTRAALLAALGALLSAAALPSAASAWTTPTRLSPASGASVPQWAGYDRAGTGVALYTRSDKVWIAQRPDGAAWGRTRVLDVPGIAGSSRGSSGWRAAVTTLGSGRLLVLGVRRSAAGSGNGTLIASVVSTGGTVIGRTSLGAWVDGKHAGVAVGGDGRGRAVVVWSRGDGLAVTRLLSGTRFATPRAPADAAPRPPAVGMGADGTVAVAWSHGSRMRTRLSSDGGRTFGGAVKLGTTVAGDIGGEPSVAVSTKGAVLAAWATQRGEAEGASYGIGYFRYAYRRAGRDRFEATVGLYRDAHYGAVGGVQAAFDGAGDPLVAWQAWQATSFYPAHQPVVATARALPDGPAAVQTISGSYGFLAAFAAGPGSRAAVSLVATDPSRPDNLLRALAVSVRGASGTFGAPQTLSSRPAVEWAHEICLAHRRDGLLSAVYVDAPSMGRVDVLTADDQAVS